MKKTTDGNAKSEGTFMWAVEQMHKGKKVRRKEAWRNSPDAYIYEHPAYGTMHSDEEDHEEETNADFMIDDFEANDWIIYEEEKFPRFIDMGLGYSLKIDSNGWIDHKCGDKSMTLVNTERDLDILESAIRQSRKLMK